MKLWRVNCGDLNLALPSYPFPVNNAPCFPGTLNPLLTYYTSFCLDSSLAWMVVVRILAGHPKRKHQGISQFVSSVMVLVVVLPPIAASSPSPAVLAQDTYPQWGPCCRPDLGQWESGYMSAGWRRPTNEHICRWHNVMFSNLSPYG